MKPVVVNNLNVPKPPAGEPALLTFEEVTTLFHEFGHALHGMLSNVHYPLLPGTNVPRDFVEYPSQFNEMWAREPAVLAHFARHYRTGEPMPRRCSTRCSRRRISIRAMRPPNTWQPRSSIRPGTSSGRRRRPAPDPVHGFEAAALNATRHGHGPVPPRYHSPYFLHMFAGGYSAGYYAYIWSEVLARDAGEWFHDTAG